MIGPMRIFLFDWARNWTGTSASLVLQCSGWTCQRFSFCLHQELNWDLCISSPAIYHSATVTYGFHLWQFQTFYSGAEGLVVVLFWLDPSEFFFCPHLDLNQSLCISSPPLYHCVTVTTAFHLWQFQVLNTGAEGLVVVLFWLDLSEFFFLPAPRIKL